LFHTDGYSALIEDYLEKRPEKLGDVRKFAQAGKLEIGPWYILSDMFMPSGESFIRNLEIGVKTASKYGMKKPGIPYSPDAFGHSSDVPKILSHTGFDAYYFCRGLGNQTKKPATEFVWESDDGSSVLALAGIVDVFDPPFDFSGKWFCGAYGLGMELPVNPAEFRERIDLIMHHAGRFMTSDSLLMMCGSDHLLPQKHLREAIAAFNSGAGNVRCVESTLRNYVQKFKKNAGDGLEHAKGELMDGRLLMVLSGTASSRIYLKRMNFDAQNLLEGYVEPWAAFASLCGKFEYDKFLEDAWKLVLKNQAHDSICGCSVDPVHLEMEQRYREIFQVSEKLFQKAARLCMGDIDQRMIFPDGYPDEFKIGVFSAVPWRENRPFELEIIHPVEINLADYTLADTGNSEIRFEIERTSQAVSTTGPFVPPGSDNKLLAVTKAIADSANLPAYGCKLLKFKKKKNIMPEHGGNTSSGFPTLKNEHLTVKIGRDGQLLVESADGAFGQIFRGLLCFEEGCRWNAPLFMMKKTRREAGKKQS
ncbi:MAG: hypothetical protein NT118_16610, partial [Lentisphaerae bacterium]|nr:hypothetical protein [Lentisphaerota bacterium]